MPRVNVVTNMRCSPQLIQLVAGPRDMRKPTIARSPVRFVRSVTTRALLPPFPLLLAAADLPSVKLGHFRRKFAEAYLVMSELAKTKNLVDAAVAGDTAVLEQLLLSHFTALEHHLVPRIPADAQRHLGAEDVLQEVLAQAFRDIKQFQYRDDGSFFAWLKTIADHRLADALKHFGRQKRGGDQHQLSSADFARSSTVATLIDIVGHDSHLPEDSAQRHEAEKAIQIALASLPENQRDVLKARYINGENVSQIAKQTGRTEAAVRGLIKRGKESLAEAMGRSSRWLSSRK
jgi:RNA polymerase sigma-70 factor, ECF subfamily